MKIYLAGPFFNKIERSNIMLARDILRGKGLDVFVPMEHKFPDDDKMSNEAWSKLVYNLDKNEIYNCDAVVAVYYGMYSDTGTAWEIGFAKALNKRIIVVHTNYVGVASLMINSCADYNIDGINSLNNFDFNNFNNNTSNVCIEQK